MNDKIQKIKKNIKHHTPEILVGAVSIAAVVVATRYHWSKTIYLQIPPETIEHMKETGDALFFMTKHGDLLVNLLPQN